MTPPQGLYPGRDREYRVGSPPHLQAEAQPPPLERMLKPDPESAPEGEALHGWLSSRLQDDFYCGPLATLPFMDPLLIKKKKKEIGKQML